jgi:hypothetical protein
VRDVVPQLDGLAPLEARFVRLGEQAPEEVTQHVVRRRRHGELPTRSDHRRGAVGADAELGRALAMRELEEAVNGEHRRQQLVDGG